jgi:hypothetical protein
MKNKYTTDRLYNYYFLKVDSSFLSVPLKELKKRWDRFRMPGKKKPFLADAVSEGLMDFVKEMGYLKK